MLKTKRVVVPLVLLQATSVLVLWSLDSVNRSSQEIITLFLAIDLLSFAIIAHVYRSARGGVTLGRRWIVAAGLALLLLLFTTLFVS
ncbi:MAG: hypothetical protein OK452_11125 [Thaumarchaeota archaeon]|nr:hypothetical protein [Nitrososphaerota archaeon]